MYNLNKFPVLICILFNASRYIIEFAVKDNRKDNNNSLNNHKKYKELPDIFRTKKAIDEFQ